MGRERKLYFVILAALILALPVSASSGMEPSLEATLVDSPARGWFTAGENVTLDINVINQGDEITIDTDPSCNAYLVIHSQTEIILDGSSACIGQSRGLDLGAGSVTSLEQLTWDLKDEDGELVESGVYSIEIVLERSGLTTTIPVEIQSAFIIDSNLELDLKLSTRDGIVREGSGALITLSLFNPTPSSIAFNEEGCKITSVIDGFEQIWSACLPGDQVLLPFEIRPLLQTVMDLSTGQHDISFALGDDVLSSQISVLSANAANTTENSGLQMGIILGEYDSDTSSIQNSVELTNQEDEDITLIFTDTCRVETWLMNQNGDVVHDSRSLKTCNEFEIYNLIEGNGGIETFNQPEIFMFDNEGCGLPPGDYTLFAEAPELSIWTSIPISFSEETGIICNDANLELITEFNQEDTLLTITPILTADIATDIFWSDNCQILVTIITATDEIIELVTDCVDRKLVQRTDTGAALSLPTLSTNLDDGQYSFELSITNAFSINPLRSGFELPLPTPETETNTQQGENDSFVAPSESLKSGTWSMITTQNGECWLLDDGNSMMAFTGAPTQIGWIPAVGVIGEYSTLDATIPFVCSEFDVTAFTITQIISESIPEVSEDIEEKSDSISTVQTEAEEINPFVTTTIVVITSTSILGILFVSIATNESWRIPATSAGLWLLGLIGRTSETNDGRYQRGRLMGYLTANPGCHFRALMQELCMSNGQITHHLKILEDEEMVWRLKDGRLVRYYPFTSDLHPSISVDKLPLPPLTPDPNSLQGKILRLLDDDEQMKKYPTQAELAVRLEKSQQLISHHLRTLHKYGLIEKRKSGLKNRYHLTKEALFLLETTEF
jgi:predicted transcriptional regulator